MLYYVPAGVPGAWADPSNIMSTVIDDALGQPFEASAVDINNDGRHDEIVRGHAHSVA